MPSAPASSQEIRLHISFLVDAFAFRSSCLSTQLEDTLALESGPLPSLFPSDPFPTLSCCCLSTSDDTHEHNVH
jgi:hypothetical protein